MNPYESMNQVVSREQVGSAAKSMAADALWDLSAEATIWDVGSPTISDSNDMLIVAVPAEAQGNYDESCRQYAHRVVHVLFVRTENGRYAPKGLPRV